MLWYVENNNAKRTKRNQEKENGIIPASERARQHAGVKQ
jgi:hypothetical protein